MQNLAKPLTIASKAGWISKTAARFSGRLWRVRYPDEYIMIQISVILISLAGVITEFFLSYDVFC